jgi:hypothetical protein
MKRFVTAFTLTASALFIGAFAQLTAATIQLSKDKLKELSTSAATPADHLKLAAYFNSEADRFEAEALQHEGLANAHRIKTDAVAEKHTMSGNTAGHCDYFAKVARQKAKADRDLAAQHELIAKGAEK